MKKIIINEIRKGLTIKNFLGDFEVINSGGWDGGTSIVKNIKFNGIENKLVIKFLLENISKNESKNFKRFKQAYINLLLLKNNNYIIPQFYFDKLVLDDNNIIPYIIMHKANKSKLEVAIDFEDFENKFTQLLDCIQFIHDNGIIHRDIKPENIFEYNGKIVLGDFDISKFSDNQLVDTDKGDRLANYHFSSPEQSNNEIGKICEKSDWYAFGQILHYLITGNSLRGQDEINFLKKGIEYKKYQELIKKLIQEKQENRLGSKEEILDFLKEVDEYENNNNELLRKKEFNDKEEELLERFFQIILKYSSTKVRGFEILYKKKVINNLFEEIIKNIELKSTNFLWYSDGRGDSDIKKINQINTFFGFFSKNNNWLFNEIELNIDKIYIYKQNGILGDNFFIIETNKQKPTGLYDGECEYEEYGLHKGKILLTRTEFDNGYKDIRGKKVDISRKTELRVRILEKKIYFILPRGLLYKNENFFREFYDKYKNNNNIITEEMFDIFNNHKFRRYKPWENY